MIKDREKSFQETKQVLAHLRLRKPRLCIPERLENPKDKSVPLKGARTFGSHDRINQQIQNIIVPQPLHEACKTEVSAMRSFKPVKPA